jgi:hypothetical protein
LEALASAPGGPRLVFVVSHVDALKARLERSLEIRVHASGSQVANAAPAAVSATRAGRGAGGAHRPTGAVEGGRALPPDPETAGNVWCAACRQSLRAAWAAKHVESAKHAAAEKKAQARQQ